MGRRPWVSCSGFTTPAATCGSWSVDCWARFAKPPCSRSATRIPKAWAARRRRVGGGSRRRAARLAEVRGGLGRMDLGYRAAAERMKKASNREPLLAGVGEILGEDGGVELGGGEKKPATPAPAEVRPAGSI